LKILSYPFEDVNEVVTSNTSLAGPGTPCGPLGPSGPEQLCKRTKPDISVKIKTNFFIIVIVYGLMFFGQTIIKPRN